MNFNADGNFMGRVLALALLVGAAAAVRGIAYGSACPFCMGGAAAAAPAAPADAPAPAN